MKPENYFDNAATTPVDPRVIREMLPFLETNWGNASSIHGWGREAMHGVDQARQRVATLIHAADPSQIAFTSGATESNNWVLDWARRSNAGGPQSGLAVSPFEHSAMLEPAARAGAEMLESRDLMLLGKSDSYFFVSIMAVNNEIGTEFEPGDFRDNTEFLHSDKTQVVGKLGYGLDPLDFASFSAHKFYGPKGIGGLYVRDPQTLSPFILGGEQEGGLRGGTLNVPGIVGMGAAAAIAQDEWQGNLAETQEMRAIVLEAIRPCSDYQINGGENVSPYILSVSFKDLEGETIVIEMDQQGFAISSGAACSSRSTDPSHVLTALKMPTNWLRGTIRISLGAFNTRESAAVLGKSLTETVKRLRNLGIT